MAIAGFGGLGVALSGIQASLAGIDVTGQNISNANTKGYARQEITFTERTPSADPVYTGGTNPIVVGNGVNTGSVEAVRDLLLNARIRSVQSDVSQSDRRRDVMSQVENLVNGSGGIADQLNNLFSAFQDLANNPENLPARSVVRETAKGLGDQFKFVDERLVKLQQDMDAEIKDNVTQVNQLASDLAKINLDISKIDSTGATPNDLINQREKKLEKLSKLINIQSIQGTAGAVNVVAGGTPIVTGPQSFALQTRTDSNNKLFLQVQSSSKTSLQIKNGKLKGLLELRDKDIPSFRNSIAELAITMVDKINSAHRAGFGLQGQTKKDFFQALPLQSNSTKLFGVEGTAFVQDSSIALDGLTTTTGLENFESNPIGQGNLTINGKSLAYNGATDTIQTIVDGINGLNSGARASLSPTGRLKITATASSNYEISALSDGGALFNRLGILQSGQTFSGNLQFNSSGTEKSLSGTITKKPNADQAAQSVRISNAVANDLTAIAAAKGEDLSSPPDGIPDQSNGPGDGANALAMSDIFLAKTLGNGTANFNEFYSSFVGQVGSISAAATQKSDINQALLDNLNTTRESVQGVSLDQELVHLIRFQNSFSASARLVSTYDQIFQTLVSLGR